MSHNHGRPGDRRVGYFTTPISIAEPRQVPQSHRVINRWNLDRGAGAGAGEGKIVFHVDPSTPSVYGNTSYPTSYSFNSQDKMTTMGRTALSTLLQ